MMSSFFQHPAIARLQAWYSKPLTHYVLGGLLISFFTLLYSLLMVHRYWQFEYFFVDNVYFHSALWKLSQFEAPVVYHRVLGHINIFGDHFHPAILIFAFLYMLIPYHEVIFVGMAVFYGLGAVFAMLVSFKLIKSRILTYALLCAYFMYLGTQNAMIFGFHEINMVAAFFFMAVYGFVYEKKPWYWLGFVLLLLTKESSAVIGVALAMFVFLVDRKHWKIATVTMIASLGYYFAVSRYVIPYFSDGRFLYQAVSLPGSLSELVSSLTTPTEKITTFGVSVGTFALLPLLNIAALPFVAQDFLVRYLFAIPGNVQYTLEYHYGVATAPMLLMSAIWSVHVWQRFITKPFIWVGLALVVVLAAVGFDRGMLRKGPLAMTLNPEFYRITQRNAFTWKLIEAVPNDGVVVAQNHLGLALSKLDVYMLPQSRQELDELKPRYIVYDSRDGQNPNNYFPSTETAFLKLAQELQAEGAYTTFFSEGSLTILKRRSE